MLGVFSDALAIFNSGLEDLIWDMYSLRQGISIEARTYSDFLQSKVKNRTLETIFGENVLLFANNFIHVFAIRWLYFEVL